MNSIRTTVAALVAISALASSFSAFAQSNAPLTRAEVKAQLVALERTGYSPAENDVNYPEKIQAAMLQQHSSEGGVLSGSQASGVKTAAIKTVGTRRTSQVSGGDPVDSIYFGH